MRSLSFRLPRTPLGVVATLALALSVLGSSAHNHALDDGLESEVRVCVVAGIAVLPAADLSGGCDTSGPPVELASIVAESMVVPVAAHRADRARAPPVFEFVPA